MNNSLRTIFGAFLFLLGSTIASAGDLSIFTRFESLPDTLPPSPKYQGYRLNVQSVKRVKESGDWFKISFTAINTGRQDIDFGKRGVAHWVQIIFDTSLYDSQLGAYIGQIREALIDQKFELEAGKVAKNQSLKVSKRLQNVSKNEPAAKQPPKRKTTESLVFTAKESTQLSQEELLREKRECPDLIIEDIKVLHRSKKWVELEFTIANIGKGPLAIYGGDDEKAATLAIQAHLSGVSRLSKGAIPVGRVLVKGGSKDNKGRLQPNGRLAAKIKVDTHSKTRYMKILILSLETNQLTYECDRTNNTKAIELK